MKLRALDALDITNVNALCKDLYTKYITNGIPFPAIDGEVPKLNEDLLQCVSAMCISQCGSDEDKFTPEELVAFSVTCPDIWVKLIETMGDLSLSSAWGKALEMIQLPAGLS